MLMVLRSRQVMHLLRGRLAVGRYNLVFVTYSNRYQESRMKKIIYKFLATVAATGVLLVGCEEADEYTPVSNTTASNLSANFTFINAVPGVPSLDLLVNNVKAGASATLGQTSRLAYTSMPITTNNIGANTNIRARGTSNPIGGVLGSGDLIFRAGNNNTNNMQASPGARYTFIAVDSISRPRPLRTLNAGNFGDTTFFNRVTGQQISTVQRNALTLAEKQRLVPLGTIPLGITDPGGPRFVLLTDALPSSYTSNLHAAVRFVNAIPNAVNPGARGLTGAQIPANMVTGITARLVPASPGTTHTVGANVNYVMAYQSFNPSVGARSTTVAFTQFVTATAGPPVTAILYNVEIETRLGSGGTAGSVIATIPFSFEPNRSYTIVASGIIGGAGDLAPKVSIVRHDNP